MNFKNLVFKNHQKKDHKINVAILMSGSGSNARNILTNQKQYPNLDFKVIVTDNIFSNAVQIGKEFGVSTFCFDLGKADFFKKTTKALHAEKIDLVVYAGLMKIAPERFVTEFKGFNIHPADLRKKDANGVPLYRGMNCIYDTIVAGEKELVSTAYWVNEKVDDGEIIDVSQPVPISLENLSDIKLLHEKLKTNEFALFQKVLTKISNNNI